MVVEERAIRILMAGWIKRLKIEKEPGWEVRVQTILELLEIYGINLDGFEEQIEKAQYATNWRQMKGE